MRLASQPRACDDIELCQAECSADSACQAYSYNRISSSCELKHTLTAMRLDPVWVSGAPTNGALPDRSSRAVTMAEYELPGDQFLEGETLDTAQAANEKDCERRCESDRSCMAVEYINSTDQCRRLSGITGLRRRLAGETQIEARYLIKRQQ